MITLLIEMRTHSDNSTGVSDLRIDKPFCIRCRRRNPTFAVRAVPSGLTCQQMVLRLPPRLGFSPDEERTGQDLGSQFGRRRFSPCKATKGSCESCHASHHLDVASQRDQVQAGWSTVRDATNKECAFLSSRLSNRPHTNSVVAGVVCSLQRPCASAVKTSLCVLSPANSKSGRPRRDQVSDKN